MNLVDRVSGTVESPLEEMMLEAFKAIIGDKLVLVSQEAAREMRRRAFYDEGRKHVYLAPQAKMGRYRCDFLLAVHKPWIHPTTICVEVDGKHHRNRILQDAERDRYMRSRRVETMRFPGWKVNKDPFRCVHTVMEKLLGEPVHSEPIDIAHAIAGPHHVPGQTHAHFPACAKQCNRLSHPPPS